MPKERRRGKAVESILEAANNKNAAKSAANLISLTIKKDTLAQYESILNTYKNFLQARAVKKADRRVGELHSEDELLIFLDACKESEHVPPMTFRSALQKELELCDRPPLSPRVMAAFRGLFYAGGNAPVKAVRGTVTCKMLEELLELTLLTAPHMYDAITVQFGAALRVSQLVDIKSGDFLAATNPPSLEIRKDKRRNARTLNKPGIGTHHKPILCEKAAKVLALLQAQTTRGELIFPRKKWNIQQYNRHIQTAAVVLGWSSSLKWDGSHVLRHGGTAFIVSNMKGRDLASLKGACVMSESMITHYSRTLEERLAK